MKELISRRTRNEFRETLVGWTLREIEIEFDNEGFVPDLSFEPSVTGQRRSYVEQFYKPIDFRDPRAAQRLVHVFEAIIDKTRSFNPAHAETLRNSLVRDGLLEKNGRFEVRSDAVQLNPLALVASALTADQLVLQIERIRSAVDVDPALAIGTAKELVETTCKTILADMNVSLDGTPDVGELLREALKHLKLLPEDVPSTAKGADGIKKTLRSLAATAAGIADMRNFYGSGHGPDGRSRGLAPRHARLAVGAATTLAMFLFETHSARLKERT